MQANSSRGYGRGRGRGRGRGDGGRGNAEERLNERHMKYTLALKSPLSESPSARNTETTTPSAPYPPPQTEVSVTASEFEKWKEENNFMNVDAHEASVRSHFDTIINEVYADVTQISPGEYPRNPARQKHVAIAVRNVSKDRMFGMAFEAFFEDNDTVRINIHEPLGTRAFPPNSPQERVFRQMQHNFKGIGLFVGAAIPDNPPERARQLKRVTDVRFQTGKLSPALTTSMAYQVPSEEGGKITRLDGRSKIYISEISVDSVVTASDPVFVRGMAALRDLTWKELSDMDYVTEKLEAAGIVHSSLVAASTNDSSTQPPEDISNKPLISTRTLLIAHLFQRINKPVTRRGIEKFNPAEASELGKHQVEALFPLLTMSVSDGTGPPLPFVGRLSDNSRLYPRFDTCHADLTQTDALIPTHMIPPDAIDFISKLIHENPVTRQLQIESNYVPEKVEVCRRTLSWATNGKSDQVSLSDNMIVAYNKDVVGVPARVARRAAWRTMSDEMFPRSAHRTWELYRTLLRQRILCLLASGDIAAKLKDDYERSSDQLLFVRKVAAEHIMGIDPKTVPDVIGVTDRFVADFEERYDYFNYDRCMSEALFLMKAGEEASRKQLPPVRLPLAVYVMEHLTIDDAAATDANVSDSTTRTANAVRVSVPALYNNTLKFGHPIDYIELEWPLNWVSTLPPVGARLPAEVWFNSSTGWFEARWFFPTGLAPAIVAKFHHGGDVDLMPIKYPTCDP